MILNCGINVKITILGRGENIMESEKSQKSVIDLVCDLLDERTFSGAHDKALNIAKHYNLKHFKKFIEENNDFVLTNKREEILNELTHRINTGDAPLFCLTGDYGCGKSAVMSELKKMTIQERKYSDDLTLKLGYTSMGEPVSIDCISVEIRRDFGIVDMLRRIFEDLQVYSSEKWIIDSYREIRETEIPTPSNEKNFQKIEDIVQEIKELPSTGIVIVLRSFFKKYKREYKKRIIGLFIDEIENVMRGEFESAKIRDVIKKYLEDVSHPKNIGDPASITIFNVASFADIEKVDTSWRADTTYRLDQFSKNLSLRPDDAQELLEKILRKYLENISIDFAEKKDTQARKILSKLRENESYNHDFYTFPIKKEVHRYIVFEVLKRIEEKGIIKRFRAYEILIRELLKITQGIEPIDLNKFLQIGDEVKSSLNPTTLVEDFNPDKIPSMELLQEEINSIEISSYQKKLLFCVIKASILKYQENQIFLSSEIIKENIDYGELERPTDADISKLLNSLIETKKDYIDIDKESNRLVINKDKLLKGADVGLSEIKNYKKLLEIEIDNEKLSEISFIKLLKIYYEKIKPNWCTDIKDNDKLIIDCIETKPNYIGHYYVSTKKETESQIQNKIDKAKTFDIGILIKWVDEKPYYDIKILLPEGTSISRKEFYNIISSEFENNNLKKIFEKINNLLKLRKTDSFELAVKTVIARQINKSKFTDIELPDFTIDILSSITPSGDKINKENLGFKNDYNGRDIFDMIYAVEDKIENGKKYVFYDQFPNITVPRFGRISPKKADKDEFRAIFNDKWIEENFFTNTGEIKKENWSDIQEEIIEEISLNLNEKKNLYFNEILKLIFGTNTISDNGIAEVYLFLLLGQEREPIPWIIEKSTVVDEIIIKNPEWSLEETQKQLLRNVEREIKKVFTGLLNNKEVDIDNLIELYQQINKIDVKKLSYDEIRHLNKKFEDIKIEAEIEIKNIDTEVLTTRIIEKQFSKVGEYLRKISRIIGKPDGEFLAKCIAKRIDKINSVIKYEADFSEINSDVRELQKKLDIIKNKKKTSSLKEINLIFLTELNNFITKKELGSAEEIINEFNRSSTLVLNQLKDGNINGKEAIGILEDKINSYIPEKIKTDIIESHIEEVKIRKEDYNGEIKNIINKKIKKIDTIIEEIRTIKDEKIYEDFSQDLSRLISDFDNIKIDLNRAANNPLSETFKDKLDQVKQLEERLGKIREENISTREVQVNKWLNDYKFEELDFSDVRDYCAEHIEDNLDKLSIKDLSKILECVEEKEFFKILIAKKFIKDLEEDKL